ncbi:hypothetical protein M9H77_26771 [Catharanthus roseus]|uniref:Uncharacterized protein n=1 Tax=Catharanthus roseus TaxID=4058 RepID=A0ACC0ADB6_CATRO|nr:hypothetical protein M9H77_26771 [Catharanthus roseus]
MNGWESNHGEYERYERENDKHDCYKHSHYECHESCHDSLGFVDYNYDTKAYGEYLYGDNFDGKGYQSEQEMYGRKEHKSYVKNQVKMSMPHFLEKRELELYLECEKEVEQLFYHYDTIEKDKVPLA